MNQTQEKWVEWVKQLQALAQAGLYYGGTQFDKERYQQIRDISAAMMSDIADLPLERVKELFCNESGYQTPKLATRAAVFHDNKILLVKENYGKWSLPGGWVDPDVTVMQNAVKETFEESGYHVHPDYIIAIIDKNKRNAPCHPFNETAVFVHCTPEDGHFIANDETVASQFFTEEEASKLELDGRKTTLEQVKTCFQAHFSKSWDIIAD